MLYRQTEFLRLMWYPENERHDYARHHYERTQQVVRIRTYLGLRAKPAQTVAQQKSKDAVPTASNFPLGWPRPSGWIPAGAEMTA